MPNNHQAQPKNKINNPTNKTNSSGVIQKHHKKSTIIFEPIVANLKALIEEESNMFNALADQVDVNKFKALQLELKKAEEKVQSLTIKHYKFITDIFLNLEAFCSVILEDVKLLYTAKNYRDKSRHFTNAQDCAEEAINYCNKLLDFSEAQLKFTPIVSKKIEIKKLVNDIITKVTPLAERNKLRLEYIFSNNLPYIMLGDNYRVSSILERLINNAIERTNEGNITITVNVFDKEGQELRDDKARELVLQLIINNMGNDIAEKIEQFIYKPYTGLISVTEDIYQGMDLNIALVKQFVHEMHGKLDVKSQEGKGTIFICSLPLTLPLIDNPIYEID